MLHVRLSGHLPGWVPFALRARWARVTGAGLPHRWHYLPSTLSRWKRWWMRLTWRLRKPAKVEDRSDGRDYRGFTARVVVAGDPMEPPAGARGLVVSSYRVRGELLHRVEFPAHDVTMPLPWPGIELVG